jgi:hypothetical protein
MPKKQTTIKRSNGNISITIENNLKATQVAPKPEKRKRRRRKPTTATNENIDELLRGGGGRESLPPLKDVSYIKPPGNSFNVWRDTIDSYNTSIPIGQAQQMGLIMAPPPPAPPAPAPLALPPPANNTFNIGNSEGNNNGPTWRDFNNWMMMSNRPVKRWNYGDNMLDDGGNDEEIQFALPPPPQAPQLEILPDNVIDSLPNISEEQKATLKADQAEKLRIKNAKSAGTRHANKNKPPEGPYQAMPEYIEAYTKAKTRTSGMETRQKEAMYKKGKRDGAAGNDYTPYQDNEDYMRGYDESIDYAALNEEYNVAGVTATPNTSAFMNMPPFTPAAGS